MKKFLAIFAVLFVSVVAFASLQGSPFSKHVDKRFDVIEDLIGLSGGAIGSLSLTGDLSGDGGDQLTGFLDTVTAASATTITAAQCGSVFVNAGAIEMELPEASTVIGCRLRFIVGNASNFTVDPDAGDIIVLSTNAAGDSLIADAVGEVLTIQAINASTWAPIDQTGTWTDSN